MFGRARPLRRQDVLLGRCWDDAALDAVLVTDRPGDPQALLAGALAHLTAVRHDPERSVLAYEALQDPMGRHIDAVRFAATREQGGPAAVEATTLLVFALIGAAWPASGHVGVSPGGQTPATQTAVQVDALLEEADELALTVLAAQPGHPGAAVARLITGRGLGLPADEWWYRFEQCRLIRPTLYPAHVHMLQALTPKWYGSDGLMFDFARRTFHDAPPGDPVLAVLPLAHVEFMVRLQSGVGPRARVDPVIHAERRRDEAAIRAKGFRIIDSPHPRALEANQLLGWYEAIFQLANAKRHLERSGARMAYYPWVYLAPDPVGSYLALRKAAKMRA